MTSFRSATSADASGIAAVAHDVWRQDILPHVCRAYLANPSRALWVALEGSEVAGFASAFLTSVRSGHRRWEIDLLAVRPVSQNQGLGTELVRRACRVGQDRAVSLARALIRVANVASQRTFASAGFATDRRPHELLLWSPKPATDARPYTGPVSLLPVDTLTYRGLWIEDLTSASAAEQRRAVRAARSIVATDGRLNTGAVIPASDRHLLAPDVRSRAHVQGQYLWFTRSGRDP